MGSILPAQNTPTISYNFSDVSQHSVSTTATDQTLLTVTIPSITIGSVLVIDTMWNCTNNGNNKIIKIQLGGQDALNVTLTTSAGFHGSTTIALRSMSAQISNNKSSASPFGTTSSSGATSLTADLSSGAVLTFIGNRADGADSLSLEFVKISA